MSNKIYLITGANRGLGKGLVESLLQRPNTTIIASVRNPSDPTAQSLSSLPVGPNSNIIIVSISSTIDTSAAAAMAELEKTHSITHIDTVIANAGIANYYGLATETPLSELREHFEVNVVGTLALFQATYPLLKKSKEGRFMAISTGGASIGDMGGFPVPVAAYGASKAALNYVVRKIHFECPELVAFVISPGWVQTDMGSFGAKTMGMNEAPVTLKESISGMLGKLDASTREETSGTFQSFDDTKYSW